MLLRSATAPAVPTLLLTLVLAALGGCGDNLPPPPLSSCGDGIVDEI